MPEIHPTLPNDGETADAADVSIPLAAILALINGNLDADNLADLAIVSGKIADGAITSSKYADNSIDPASKFSQWDGWVPVTDTWTYASSTTVTVPTNATQKYDVGDFIKFVQGGTVQYFRVQGVTSTILTLQPISTSTLTNVTISAVYYSKARNPHGMTNNGFDWWQELGRDTVLTGTKTSLDIQNIPPMKYLKIRLVQIRNGTSLTSAFRFNNDSASNYVSRTSENAAAENVTTGSSLTLGSNTLTGMAGEIDMLNMANHDKAGWGWQYYFTDGNSSSNIFRNTVSWKWANTSAQINRVNMIATVGAYDVGSELIVLGHN